MHHVSIEIIRNFQFAAICFSGACTLLLAFLLLRRGGLEREVNRARWLMAASTGLLMLHFLLQYTLKLRAMGYSQPLQLNLLMFMPAAWLMSLGVLVLQRQDKLTRLEWMTGGTAWGVTAALMVAVSKGDGEPFFCDTPQMRMAENIGAALYFASQCFYVYHQLRELRRMYQSLDNYYDRDTAGKLQWMRVSIWTLAIIALFAPLAIIISGPIMFIFGIIILAGIGYLVISFRDYVISKDVFKVIAAQQNARRSGTDTDQMVANDISEDERQRMNRAIAKWLNTGHYLQSGLRITTVCEEMGVSQQQLRDWFPAAGYESYADWMQQLRIERAKSLMREHPEFRIDYIAAQCGFNSEKYFYPVFKKYTGITPQQFVENLA